MHPFSNDRTNDDMVPAPSKIRLAMATRLLISDVVDCKRCDELLAAYKDAISLYTNAQRRIRGLLGDNFILAFKELKRLRLECRHADDALMAHLRQDHGRLSEKAQRHE